MRNKIIHWNEKENNKEKHLFKSFYCSSCQQTKPCYVLSKEFCCNCVYEKERAKSKVFSSYQKLLKSKQRERKENYQQLELLRNYQGCKKCKSKEIDGYSLYKKNKLICWACLVKKGVEASSPINFTRQSKWYKKQWGINLREILENYQWLPVNKNCADEWLKDKEHLDNCQCLEQENKETYLFFTNSLQKIKESLAKCQCEISEKVRVGSDYYSWCENCEREIPVASKKRVIKNRNDPRFWGIMSKWMILCLECLGKNFYERMEEWQKKKFREYRRRGYV